MKTKTRTSPNQQSPVKKHTKSASSQGSKKKKKVTSTKIQKQNKKAPIVTESALPDLSSVNIAKLLSNFMALRSVVKSCTKTLNQVEKFMDSTWSMFNVAQHMMGENRRPKNPFSFLLPSPKDKAKGKSKQDDDEEIPIIKFPGEDDNTSKSNSKSSPPPMLGKIMENIDMNQIFKIMQSPIFQKMVSGLLKGRPASTTSSIKDKDNE